MTEAAGYPSAQFSNSFITENPQRSLEELTEALGEEPDDAELYSQRAYAHILLHNYNDAVLDAKRSLELQPNNANAFLRKGEAEFHLKNYSAAKDTFKQGQTLNSSASSFSSWIKKCEETLNTSSCPEGQSTNQKTSQYRHDWYQTESQVIVTVMIKNVRKEDVHLQFAERQVMEKIYKDWCLQSVAYLLINVAHLPISGGIGPQHKMFKKKGLKTFSMHLSCLTLELQISGALIVRLAEALTPDFLQPISQAVLKLTLNVHLPSEENYNLTLVLLHSIVPEQSTFKVLSTKIEIKMKKTEALRWDKLEGQDERPLKRFTPESMHKYPSSSHYTKNWDKLVGEIKEEEKNEKLEGDAALNQLFQQIYTDGNDEVKRAMNKSFQESGGTVLSTNWSDVGKKKVEVNPPDDMEYKKF